MKVDTSKLLAISITIDINVFILILDKFMINNIHFYYHIYLTMIPLWTTVEERGSLPELIDTSRTCSSWWGDHMIKVLIEICNRIWKTGK